MLVRIKRFVLTYYAELLNVVLGIIILLLIVDDHDYGGKSAKEWHLLYAEQKQENASLVIYKDDLFNRLLKLETCHKGYEEQDIATRLNTPISLYCNLFTKD